MRLLYLKSFEIQFEFDCKPPNLYTYTFKRGELQQLATTLNKPLNSYEFSKFDFTKTLRLFGVEFFDFEEIH